uniref:phage major tail tube protein n=1 Tax=Oceanobacter kriegii TaxID=64972 RepID=UPI0004839C48
NSYLTEVSEITLPKLQRKMEDFQTGGMDMPIKTDMGGEAMQLEWTCGGLMEDALRQWGLQSHDGVGLRFAGSYQRDDGTAPSAVEISVRGRHSELDTGSAKKGDATEFKAVTELSYYKLTIDGDDVIEIDILNMKMIVNGEDLLEEHRSAIGI